MEAHVSWESRNDGPGCSVPNVPQPNVTQRILFCRRGRYQAHL